jgi:multidrug efflux pump subunit AcrB
MKLYVKNNRDEMVPFSSFMKIKKCKVNEINRYNMYTTAAIRGGAAKVLVRVRRLLRYNKLPKKHCRTDLILTGLPFL